MKKSQITIATDKPVTEKFLEEKLKGFATKDDLKKELSAYATKEDLTNAHQELIQDISDLFYKKFEENDARWEKNDKNFERVLIGQDRILKELVNIRDDNNASTLHFERNDETLEEHDIRLKALEIAKN